MSFSIHFEAILKLSSNSGILDARWINAFMCWFFNGLVGRLGGSRSMLAVVGGRIVLVTYDLLLPSASHVKCAQHKLIKMLTVQKICYRSSVAAIF